MRRVPFSKSKKYSEMRKPYAFACVMAAGLLLACLSGLAFLLWVSSGIPID